MLRAVTCLWAIVFLAPAVVAGDEAPTPDKPRPNIRLSEYDFDLGKVIHGELIERAITIYNDGEEPLTIFRVDRSCSCTTILSFPDAPIAGHGEGKVLFTIEPAAINPGDTHKTISIESSDPVVSKIIIRFTAEVVRPIRTVPEKIVLEGLFDKTKESVVEVMGEEGFTFEVQEFKARKAYCEIVKQETLAEGRRHRLQLRAAAHEKPETVKDVLDIVLKLSDGRVLNLAQQIIIRHQSYVIVKPLDGIVFSNKETDRLLKEGAAPVEKILNVFTTAPEFKFAIKNVEVRGTDAGVFQVATKPRTAGRDYEVIVSLKEYPKASVVNANVVITTDEPGEPTYEVKIFARFGKKR